MGFQIVMVKYDPSSARHAYESGKNLIPSNYLNDDLDYYKDYNSEHDLLGGIAAHWNLSLLPNLFKNMEINSKQYNKPIDPNYNPLSDVSDPYFASRFWEEFYDLQNEEQVKLKEEQLRNNLEARKKIGSLDGAINFLAYPFGNIAGGDLSYFIPILKGGKILKTTKAFIQGAARVGSAEAAYQIPKGLLDPTAEESVVPFVSEEALFIIPTVGLFGGVFGSALNAHRKSMFNRGTPPPSTPQGPKLIESDYKKGKTDKKVEEEFSKFDNDDVIVLKEGPDGKWVDASTPTKKVDPDEVFDIPTRKEIMEEKLAAAKSMEDALYNAHVDKDFFVGQTVKIFVKPKSYRPQHEMKNQTVEIIHVGKAEKGKELDEALRQVTGQGGRQFIKGRDVETGEIVLFDNAERGLGQGKYIINAKDDAIEMVKQNLAEEWYLLARKNHPDFAAKYSEDGWQPHEAWFTPEHLLPKDPSKRSQLERDVEEYNLEQIQESYDLGPGDKIKLISIPDVDDLRMSLDKLKSGKYALQNQLIKSLNKVKAEDYINATIVPAYMRAEASKNKDVSLDDISVSDLIRSEAYELAETISNNNKIDPHGFWNGEFYSIGGFFDQVVPLDKNGKVIEPEFKEHFYKGNALTHALFFGENVNNVLLKQIMDRNDLQSLINEISNVSKEIKKVSRLEWMDVDSGSPIGKKELEKAGFTKDEIDELEPILHGKPLTIKLAEKIDQYDFPNIGVVGSISDILITKDFLTRVYNLNSSYDDVIRTMKEEWGNAAILDVDPKEFRKLIEKNNRYHENKWFLQQHTEGHKVGDTIQHAIYGFGVVIDTTVKKGTRKKKEKLLQQYIDGLITATEYETKLYKLNNYTIDFSQSKNTDVWKEKWKDQDHQFQIIEKSLGKNVLSIKRKKQEDDFYIRNIRGDFIMMADEKFAQQHTDMFTQKVLEGHDFIEWNNQIVIRLDDLIAYAPNKTNEELLANLIFQKKNDLDYAEAFDINLVNREKIPLANLNGARIHKLSDKLLYGNEQQQSQALMVIENQARKDIANAEVFDPTKDSIDEWNKFKGTEWVFDDKGNGKEIHLLHSPSEDSPIKNWGYRLIRNISKNPYFIQKSPYDRTKDMVAEYASPNNPVYNDSKLYNDALAELSYMMDKIVSDGALLTTSDKIAQHTGVTMKARQEFDPFILKIREEWYNGFAVANDYPRADMRFSAFDMAVEVEKTKQSLLNSLNKGDPTKLSKEEFNKLMIRELEQPGQTLMMGYDPKVIQGVQHTAKEITKIMEYIGNELHKRNMIGEPKAVQNEIIRLEKELDYIEKSILPDRWAIADIQGRIKEHKEYLESIKDNFVTGTAYYPHLYRQIPLSRREEFIDDLAEQFKRDEELGFSFDSDKTIRERAEDVADSIMRSADEFNFVNLTGRGKSKHFLDRNITWHDKDKMLKWIDNNVEAVLYNYINKVGPLIKMNDLGAGDVMLGNMMADIDKHFGVIKSGATKEQIKKIEIDQEEFKASIADLRDMALGRIANGGNVAGLQARTARAIKNYSTMLFAGKFLFSSFADIGHMHAVIGAEEVGIHIKAWATQNKELLESIGLNKEYVEEQAFALETILGSTSRFIQQGEYRAGAADLSNLSPAKFEELLQKGANAMHMLNGLLPFTAASKEMAGTMIVSGFIRKAIQLTDNVPVRSDGKKYVQDIPKSDLAQWRDLSSYGLSKKNIIDIAQKNGAEWEATTSGNTTVYQGNINNWPNKKLARKFELAAKMQTEVAIMIPGLSAKSPYLFDVGIMPNRGRTAVKNRKEASRIDDEIREMYKNGASDEEVAPLRERFFELQSEYLGYGRYYAPMMGLMFQFRTFGIGAAQKITQRFAQGAQRSPYTGIALTIFIAYIANYLRNPYYQYLDQDEQMLTALEYSGYTNWLLDFNTSLETLAPMITGDEFGLRAALGMEPKWSYDDNIDRAGGGFGTGYASMYKAMDYLMNNSDMTEREKISTLRQLTPFNNLFYLSPAAKALQNKILDQGKYDDNWYGDR